MIEIRRPIAVPRTLLAKGRQLRDEYIARHARGDTDFTFDRGVYGDAG
jgi:hypothetical protein